MGRSRSKYYTGYYSSSYGKKAGERHFPNPLPYFVVLLLAAAGLIYFHYFAYHSLSGKVTNAYTGAPMPGVSVLLSSSPVLASTPVSPTTPVAPIAAAFPLSSTTAADGTFLFDRTPDRPVLTVSMDGFAPQTMSADGKSSLDIALIPNQLSGRILTADGKAVAGARILSGNATTVSATDGTYHIKDLPADRKLVIKAAGYTAKQVGFDKVNALDITLDPFVAKAIYISADSVATPGKLQSLLDLIDRTELNAVVIDVKGDNSGTVLYGSQLPIIQQLQTAQQIIPDLPGLLTTLKEKHIYTIARLPVFWDQVLTAAKPDWSLKSKKTPGQPWSDAYGKRWANPYSPEVWDYNIQIAGEVAALGFDEVQFDQVQFPSVGALDDIDFGPNAVGKKRVDAISSFLDRAYTTLSPRGTYISVVVLGLTPYVNNDQGIGQQFEDIAQRSDYICPTIYPSSFADGFDNYAKPEDHPSELIGKSVKVALGRFTPQSVAKLRPWLQDFTGKVTYDTTKVRAEIDAAETNGATGWQLWNFGNTYTDTALKP